MKAGEPPSRCSSATYCAEGTGDGAGHLVQRAEPVFPGVDERGVFGVDGHHGLDLRALVGIESAERIFRGERDMVFAMGHRSRSGHQSPRHSLMSIMLRRSHVFTVFTGVSNLVASCSRLQPL